MESNLTERSLFLFLFGKAYLKLPAAWQRLHDVRRQRVFEGEATVMRGRNIFSKTIATILGLPPSSDVSIRFVVEPIEGDHDHGGPVGERWQRFFGSLEFTTLLFAPKNLMAETKQNDKTGIYLEEQFGALRFAICLTQIGDEIHWGLTDWWVAGVRLPRAIMPISQTKEFVDLEGRYRFDIDIILPVFGRLIAYKGWLDV